MIRKIESPTIILNRTEDRLHTINLYETPTSTHYPITKAENSVQTESYNLEDHTLPDLNDQKGLMNYLFFVLREKESKAIMYTTSIARL